MKAEWRSVLNVKTVISSVRVLGFEQVISVGSWIDQGICPRNSDANPHCLALPRTITFWPCWHSTICSTRCQETNPNPPVTAVVKGGGGVKDKATPRPVVLTSAMMRTRPPLWVSASARKGASTEV